MGTKLQPWMQYEAGDSSSIQMRHMLTLATVFAHHHTHWAGSICEPAEVYCTDGPVPISMSIWINKSANSHTAGATHLQQACVKP